MPIVVIGGGLDGRGYRYRIARLLRGAGGEIPRSLRNSGGGEGRGRGSRRMERRRNANRRRVPVACARHSRRTSGRGERRPEAEPDRPAEFLGRRHHRLSPAHDRFAQLHAESRRSMEGARRGHPVRRMPDARGRWKWTASAMPRRCTWCGISSTQPPEK